MESKKNKNNSLLIRVAVCIFILLIWTFWITTQKKEFTTTTNENDVSSSVPEAKLVLDKPPQEQAERAKGSKTLNPKPETKNIELKVQSPKPKVITTSKGDLPKLVNLSPEKQEKKIGNKGEKKLETQSIKHETTSYKPQVPPEARLAIGGTSQTNNTNLRNKIKVSKIALKSALEIINKDSTNNQTEDKTWLPQYLFKSSELNKSIKNVQNNLDQIAAQIELIGLVNSPQGSAAAILRNKLNNKTEILKLGDKYQEFTVQRISSDEIVLSNQNLNKTYTKKLINSSKSN